MNEFCSILREEIEEFLEARHANNEESTYLHYRNTLKSLDKYLQESGASSKNISKSQIDGWVGTLRGKPVTIQGKAIQARIFCGYLRNLGFRADLPDIPITRNDYVAYHFTDEEIDRLYDWIDNLEQHYRKLPSNTYLFWELPVIFRIMFCCGTRLGETLSLKVGDIDFVSGCLHMIHDTKGRKQRIVPMHPELTLIIKDYCTRMKILENPGCFLFQKSEDSNDSVAKREVSHVFHAILLKMGIATLQKVDEESLRERGPCIHCLRHAFSFRALHQCESAGVKINDMIPYLSVYLGHERLYETEKYLKFSPDLQPIVTERFEEFSSSLFPEIL